MKRIRICHVVCDITGGGVESVLLNYFSHMDRSNYELDLVTYDIKSNLCADRFRALGFNIITVPSKREGFGKSVASMSHVIKNGHYDVVHAHLTEWNCIPVGLAWVHRVEKRISHSHMADSAGGFRKQVLFAAQKWLNKRFATKLCACGEEAGVYLYGRKLYEAGRVEILNNAIETDRFEPNPLIRKNIRRMLHLSEEIFCVGHVGRFLPQKNHLFMIDIFAEILKVRPQSCLILLGQGELEEKVHEKVKASGIEAKVKFLGVRDDISQIYQAMDVFCLPSLFEGFPVSAIEAQAAQLPCIISDRVSEKIKITENVRLCSLSQSAGDWAKVMMEVKGKACKLPPEYNIENMAAKWDRLYL